MRYAAEHIEQLILDQLTGNISPDDEAILKKALEEDEKTLQIWQEYVNALALYKAGNYDWNKEKAWEAVNQTLSDKKYAKTVELQSTVKKRSSLISWNRWPTMIAAAVIIIIVSLTLLIPNQWWRKAPGSMGEKTPSSNDVPAPTNTRAVITLADGSKVYLDSASNGTIANENNVAVVKNSKGEIEYRGQRSEVGGTKAYNTLFNPRGSKVISLTLSDGTKVWLNSESSLRYPASFASGVYPAKGGTVSRDVEITGEAYFEVKHNSKQPFKVHLPNGGVVEDIGTSFNVNAYNDEQATRTTLIEGAVKVSAKLSDLSFSAVKLKPGEQSIITHNSSLTIDGNVDIDAVTAWKANQFIFSRQDIKSIMRQIARWYDVEVSYVGTISNATFSGIVSRESNISQVLKIMEQAGMKFQIEGKKIIVQ